MMPDRLFGRIASWSAVVMQALSSGSLRPLSLSFALCANVPETVTPSKISDATA